ncbi:MAG: hypothetical protein LBD20_01435 [Spirochaetaceae bacterium]|jgi:hypothetical protein|nr:hypothetical protein [Spirochaetaceae bacterium]
MGFWDIVGAGLEIVNELAKDSTQKVVNWINEAKEHGAAGVYLKRAKDTGVWKVKAKAVDENDRTLATKSWTIERASGIKRFVAGEVGGGTEYEQGLADLFQGEDKIFYDLTIDDDDFDDEDEDEDEYEDDDDDDE